MGWKAVRSLIHLSFTHCHGLFLFLLFWGGGFPEERRLRFTADTNSLCNKIAVDRDGDELGGGKVGFVFFYFIFLEGGAFLWKKFSDK